MLIKRILVTSTLMFGVLHAHAMSEGSDSHCVVGKDNTLFNQCGYAVDVSFCVEKPQQTKNFFDSSDAFRCPNGGLSTLGPGREEGNILHGTVHWFACDTKYRGKGRWGYVAGSGYRGHCIKNESSANSDSRLSWEQLKQAEATRAEQALRTSRQTMNPGQMPGRAQQAESGRGSSNSGSAASAGPGGLTVVSAKDCIPEQNKLREMLERNDARASVPRPARWPSPSDLTQEHVARVVEDANSYDRARVEELLPGYVGSIARNTSEVNNARQNQGDVQKYEFDLLMNYFNRCFFRARIGLR